MKLDVPVHAGIVGFMPARRAPLSAPCLVAVLALAACGESLLPTSGAWTQVVAGDLFTCALAADGAAWCWGQGSLGQLGNHATIAQTTPARVAGGITFGSLAAGSSHVCGVTAAGAVWCWGYDDYGELGLVTGACNNNLRFFSCSDVPMAVPGAPPLDSIVAAAFTTCGLARDGAAWCWGLNDHGQRGTGGPVGVATDTPARVVGGLTFQAITLDVNHACARTAGGILYCWGSNDFGQLGADTLLTPRCGSGVGFYCAMAPVASAAGLAAATVSAGSTHTCALAPGGMGYCWGSNEYGVLGNPSAPGGSAPVRVAGASVFTQISSGADHTCAVDADGEAWCWGLDTFGQLGNASTSSACPAFGNVRVCATSPALVLGAPTFKAVSAGSGHSCGLTPGGEIWCWGRGAEGQLGDGASMSSETLVRVARP
jgi:alpha-tubulin suppressor-like RCC1 family protein